MENNEKILKSGVLVFVFILFSRIFGYLFRIIIARYDINLYGQYNLIIALIDFVIPFLLLGFSLGIVRYVSFYNSEKEKSNLIISSAIKIAIPVSILAYFVFFIFSSKISELLNLEDSNLIKFLALLIPIMISSKIFSSILEAKKLPALSTFLSQLIPNLLRFIIIIPFIYIGLGKSGIISAFIISYSFSLLTLFFASKTFYKIKPGFSKELLKFSWPLIFVSLGMGIMVQIDTIFLGIFTNIEEVSLYSVAYPTSQLLTIFSISILSLFLPIITEKFSQKKSIKKEYKFVTSLIFILSALSIIILTLFGKKIILLFFGLNYIDAYIPLIILSFAYLFYNISQPSYNILLMKEKTSSILIIFSISLTLNIILNSILIPYFHSEFAHGMYGAAIATLISFSILSVMIMIHSKKE